MSYTTITLTIKMKNRDSDSAIIPIGIARAFREAATKAIEVCAEDTRGSGLDFVVIREDFEIVALNDIMRPRGLHKRFTKHGRDSRTK